MTRDEVILNLDIFQRAGFIKYKTLINGIDLGIIQYKPINPINEVPTLKPYYKKCVSCNDIIEEYDGFMPTTRSCFCGKRIYSVDEAIK